MTREHGQQIEQQLTEKLFHDARLAMSAMAAGTGFYLALVFPYAPREALWLWFTLAFAVQFVLLAYLFFFHRFVKSHAHKAYVFNALIVCLVLSLGGSLYTMLGYAESSLLTQLILVILVIGIHAGAAFTLSANKWSFIVSSVPYSLFTAAYLFQREDKTLWLLGGILLVLNGILIWLSNRYYHALRDLVSKNLMIEEQKTQIQQTLDEVNKLKQQQDGDYFLTALLLQPLGVNRTSGENVQVDFRVKQYKKFTFGKRQAEIGGDICIAHEILLRDRSYTAFINADAMGKSIQGAGGALVLGSVFQTIIERTRTVTVYSQNYPERWLKNAFMELHTVFASFDGTMLSSAIIGLVDHNDGMLYFINAEHPWPVLLRADRTEFLRGKTTYYKLGMTGLQGGVHIETFHLLPGDIIVIGSDGKDDLLLEKQTSGERVMNEDENLFLQVVQRSDGDLDRIIACLEETGRLADDLSLIRIEYSPQRTALEDAPARTDFTELRSAIESADQVKAEQLLLSMEIQTIRNSVSLRELLTLLLRMRDYKNAAIVAENLALLVPNDIFPLYYASYCHFRQKNFVKAADLGERVRLRSPGFVRNLTDLARIYLNMKNYKRAEELVRAAEHIEPENHRIVQIRDLIYRIRGTPV